MQAPLAHVRATCEPLHAHSAAAVLSCACCRPGTQAHQRQRQGAAGRVYVILRLRMHADTACTCAYTVCTAC